MKAGLIAVSLLFVVFPTALYAQSLIVDNDRFLFSLGLNEDQVSQVLALERQSQLQIDQTVTDLETTRDQISKLLEAPEPDMQQIDSLIDQEQKQRTDLERSIISTQLKLRQIMGNDNYLAYRDFVPTGAEFAAVIPYVVQVEMIIAGRPFFYPYDRHLPYRLVPYPYYPYPHRFYRGPHLW